MLVIAHAFPPCGGAGVQRTAKTVKYLSLDGWDVTVLTVDPRSYGVHDPSYDRDVPAQIVRTPFFDPVAQLTQGSGAARSTTTRALPRRRSVVRAFSRQAWAAFDRHLLIPDRFITWYPRAVRAALVQHRERAYDVVYATGDPYSAYLIAMRVAKRTGTPFVIDMRDPWTLVPYRSEKLSVLRAALERRLEARVLEACTACVFANRAIEAYAEAYPTLADKFQYIPNGYDPEDFDGVEPKRFERFTLVHNGSFLPGYRTPHTLLNAVSAIVRDEPRRRGRLQILMVGKIGEERAFAERLGLQDVVSHTGYLPHRESLSYVLGADALLLVGGAHRWEETGKVYEYLAAGRPILALVEPDGAAADLLRRFDAARVVPRDSVAATASALCDMMDAPTPAHRPAWLPQYRRDVLAARIGTILNAAAVRSEPAFAHA